MGLVSIKATAQKKSLHIVKFVLKTELQVFCFISKALCENNMFDGGCYIFQGINGQSIREV